jgi:hypothetical protein
MNRPAIRRRFRDPYGVPQFSDAWLSTPKADVYPTLNVCFQAIFALNLSDRFWPAAA